MKFLPPFAMGVLLLAGCAGAPPREPAHRVSPPAAAPSPGPELTMPGISPRPGADVASPTKATGPRFIRVLLSGGASMGAWPPMRRVA